MVDKGMIKPLSPEVRDQIAAGEVVERPAHLVKELIENSLDAGATELQVRVSNQARNIEVIDNGSGIAQNELALALERFATSKIRVTDDLWNLSTFGFRGEALASACAISRLQLTSRKGEDKSAHQIKAEFGKLGTIASVSGEPGTKLLLKDLFENVPARLKFLKSESAENQAVRQVIKSFALAQPQFDLKYFENEKLMAYYAKTDNWLKRCENVLEAEGQLYASTFLNEDWKAEVVFSSPQFVSRTAKQMWFFVQGRWVQDRSLQAAVMDAYRSLLMHGEYPYVVVKLSLPPDQVDVNIHPTKSQVKFLNPSQAFRTVHHALRQALETAPWLKSYAIQPEKPSKLEDSSSKVNSAEQLGWHNQDSSFGQTRYQSKTSSLTTGVTLAQLETAVESRETFQPISTESNHRIWSRLEVIGQLSLTYIITQSEDGLVLIDQHAAHERVAFERLMKGYREGGIQTQDFLFPLAVDLTGAQMEALQTQQAQLQKLGLYFELLGPTTIGVVSCPLFMKESSLAYLLTKTADEILEMGGSFQFDKKLIDICATFACHSVVRAGQSLSIMEMKSLLEQMDEFPHSSFCPHGRPVSVRWSLIELEKEFGRRN